MTETRTPLPVTVCRADTTRWRDYRGVRLAMLLDEPTAFGSTFAREVELGDEDWRERLQGTPTWLAYEDALPLGSVTLWHAPDQPGDERYLVGMWVAAHARGRGVAEALVRALLDEAAASAPAGWSSPSARPTPGLSASTSGWDSPGPGPPACWIISLGSLRSSSSIWCRRQTLPRLLPASSR